MERLYEWFRDLFPKCHSTNSSMPRDNVGLGESIKISFIKDGETIDVKNIIGHTWTTDGTDQIRNFLANLTATYPTSMMVGLLGGGVPGSITAIGSSYVLGIPSRVGWISTFGTGTVLSNITGLVLMGNNRCTMSIVGVGTPATITKLSEVSMVITWETTITTV